MGMGMGIDRMYARRSTHTTIQRVVIRRKTILVRDEEGKIAAKRALRCCTAGTGAAVSQK